MFTHGANFSSILIGINITSCHYFNFKAVCAFGSSYDTIPRLLWLSMSSKSCYR